MDNNTLQQELNELKRELIALKSPQGPITNITGFTASIQNPGTKVKITYADGDNAIITRHYAIGNNWIHNVLTKVENNEQYILTYRASFIKGYQIVSTRPILSVENVS